jgi:hypothetical protein
MPDPAGPLLNVDKPRFNLIIDWITYEMSRVRSQGEERIWI